MLFDKTFYRFIVVGIINTLFGSSVMFIMYNVLNQSYWMSSASNYILGSILSYFLNKYFTFQNKEKNIRTVLFFTVNIAVCYFLAYGCAKPMVAHVCIGSTKVQENISMVVGMCLFVALNYLGQRCIVFKEEEPKRLDESGSKS